MSFVLNESRHEQATVLGRRLTAHRTRKHVKGPVDVVIHHLEVAGVCTCDLSHPVQQARFHGRRNVADASSFFQEGQSPQSCHALLYLAPGLMQVLVEVRGELLVLFQ